MGTSAFDLRVNIQVLQPPAFDPTLRAEHTPAWHWHSRVPKAGLAEGSAWQPLQHRRVRHLAGHRVLADGECARHVRLQLVHRVLE